MSEFEIIVFFTLTSTVTNKNTITHSKVNSYSHHYREHGLSQEFSDALLCGMQQCPLFLICFY